MRCREFMRDGIRLALCDSGGEGRPVVFQHGLCGDADQAAEAFPAEAGFRLITLECRGHGRSETGDAAHLSMATFADDLAAMMDTEAIAPAAVGGISMGAAIALRLAVRRPDLVRAVVLARPAWLTEAGPENMRAIALAGRLLREFPAEEARRRFDDSEEAAGLEREGPDNLASLRGFFSIPKQRETAELLARIAADGPGVGLEEIGRISVPALVIGNERDAVHPLAYAERLASLIPAAVLERITPKADSKERYLSDLRACLRAFLEGL